jgi:hypothetical protein
VQTARSLTIHLNINSIKIIFMLFKVLIIKIIC